MTTRNQKKISNYYKYIYGFIGVGVLIASEITVRYSGNSLDSATIYYLTPVVLIPIVYLFLIRTFKYENLN